MTDLRTTVLAELADRYTGLGEDYRRYVSSANEETLRRVLDLARADAPGAEIMTALNAEDRREALR